MPVVQWPSRSRQTQVVAVTFVLTPVCMLLALGLLASVGPASAATIGTPIWHGTWLALLAGRAALVAGLALWSRFPHRGKRGPLAGTAQALAVLVLAIGLAGYAVALYGPNLSLLPGSEDAIAAGEQGVFDAIVSAASGGLTLSGHLLLGVVVLFLALSAEGSVLRTWTVLSGVLVGLVLSVVALGGMLTIDPESVVLSTTVALVAYCWIAGLGIALFRRGSRGAAIARPAKE